MVTSRRRDVAAGATACNPARATVRFGLPVHRAPRSGADGAVPPDRKGQLLITHQPHTIEDAVALRTAEPAAMVVAGGTGVLPALNAGLEPPALIDLSRVAGMRDVAVQGERLRLGAGVTYTQVIEELAGPLPGLAGASRTVASRQVRNRGTVAGALVLGDPSGDALAVLGATAAVVEVTGPAGVRLIAADAFVTAPGDCELRADELVTALIIPADEGPVAYAKAGARNAMARAVCGVAVALHPSRRAVTACVVGAGPTAIRPLEAEAFATEAWDGGLGEAELRAFGDLVAAAVRPHADGRASAEYRRHAAAVLARRALGRAWGPAVMRSARDRPEEAPR